MNAPHKDYGLQYEVYGYRKETVRESNVLRAAVTIAVSMYFLYMGMSIIQGIVTLYQVTQ